MQVGESLLLLAAIAEHHEANHSRFHVHIAWSPRIKPILDNRNDDTIFVYASRYFLGDDGETSHNINKQLIHFYD